MAKVIVRVMKSGEVIALAEVMASGVKDLAWAYDEESQVFSAEGGTDEARKLAGEIVQEIATLDALAQEAAKPTPKVIMPLPPVKAEEHPADVGKPRPANYPPGLPWPRRKEDVTPNLDMTKKHNW